MTYFRSLFSAKRSCLELICTNTCPIYFAITFVKVYDYFLCREYYKIHVIFLFNICFLIILTKQITLFIEWKITFQFFFFTEWRETKGMLEKENILSWRGLMVVQLFVCRGLCFPTQHCLSAEDAVCFFFLTDDRILLLRVKKWPYSCLRNGKTSPMQSFCLWEGKVDQQGLRNQRIKS